MVDWDDIWDPASCLICTIVGYKKYEPATWKTFVGLILFFIGLILIMTILAIIINH